VQSAKLKVALIGDLCLDVFFQVSQYPEKGGDGLADKLVTQTGGSVSNTAIALAHLGCDSQLYTHTGKDLWSRQVLSTLVEEGVNIEHVIQEDHEATGVTFLAVTPDGERTMFTYRGANALLRPEEITHEKFSDIAALHLSGYGCLAPPQSDAIWKAVDIAYDKGMTITLDIGVEPAHILGEKLVNLLSKLTLIILGEPEARAIAGTASVEEAISFLLDHGVKMIGLKLGKDGCLIITREARVHSPGFKVEVVDTTGAGDAFSAGMIFGICQKWSLPKIGLLANVMGALAATRWGAGAEQPQKSEIIEFLQAVGYQNSKDQTLFMDLISSL
jgi:ribokinase